MVESSVKGTILIALLSMLLVVDAKSIAGFSGRILDGETAKEGQFPHQVSLRGFLQPDSPWHFCSGALVSENFVLTTANCVRGYIPSNVTILVGTILLIDSETKYNVSSIINHPQFDPNTMVNDISVVKAAQPIGFTFFVRPIRLPISDIGDAVPATISGWGRINVRIYSSDPNLFIYINYVITFCIST